VGSRKFPIYGEVRPWSGEQLRTAAGKHRLS
jgi:hypothetical protein